MRRRYRTSGNILLAVIAVCAASYVCLFSGTSISRPSYAYESRWTWQENIQYVGWKLGLRKDPPYDPLLDLIKETMQPHTMSNLDDMYDNSLVIITGHQMIESNTETDPTN